MPSTDAKTAEERIVWGVKITIIQGSLMKLQLDRIEAKLDQLIGSNSKPAR